MPKGRILAVDDQRYFRELVEGLLAEEGFEAQTASSGEEALRLLDQSRFDVVKRNGLCAVVGQQVSDAGILVQAHGQAMIPIDRLPERFHRDFDDPTIAFGPRTAKPW